MSIMISRIWAVSTKIADERRQVGLGRGNEFSFEHSDLPAGNPDRDAWDVLNI